MFSTASLAVVGLTVVGTVLNLYFLRRRAREPATGRLTARKRHLIDPMTWRS